MYENVIGALKSAQAAANGTPLAGAIKTNLNGVIGFLQFAELPKPVPPYNASKKAAKAKGKK